MNALLITTLVMGLISANTVSAAQEINHADGEEKMSIVSSRCGTSPGGWQLHKTSASADTATVSR